MRIRIRFCPDCGSTELRMVAGGEIGMTECEHCKFRASIFPEKEIEIKDKKLLKE